MVELKKVTAKILSEDKKVISYRPSWKNMTGSITSAILLQQIRFHWVNKGSKPFYKFFSPPQTGHDKYRIGDSWIEELGFTLAELRGAMKKVAKRLVKEDLEDLKSALDGHFVGYFRDQNHVTWHYFNEDYFLEQVIKLYSGKDEEHVPHAKFPLSKNESSPHMLNSHLAKDDLARCEINASILSETPTKTPISNSGQKPAVLRPSNSEEPRPEKPKPLTVLKETFLESGCPWAVNKKEEGFFWSQLRIIYTLAGEDVNRGKALIREAVKRLKADGLSISGPQSLVKTVRAIITEQKSIQPTNGKLPPGWTREQYEEFKARHSA